MLKIPREVYLIGKCGSHCQHIPDDAFVIRCNNNCTECRTDMRVIGSEEIDPNTTQQNILAITDLSPFEADIRFLITHATPPKTSLWVSDHGIVNSFDFVPMTGLIAMQIAFLCGAKKILYNGMPLKDEDEYYGVHHLPLQRDYMRGLIAAGYLERFGVKA